MPFLFVRTEGGGIRRPGPTGPGLSESPFCRCFAAASRAEGARRMRHL